MSPEEYKRRGQQRRDAAFTQKLVRECMTAMDDEHLTKEQRHMVVVDRLDRIDHRMTKVLNT